MRLLLLIPLLALMPLAFAQEGVAKEDPLTVIHIERAKADIREMEELGIGTGFVKDKLGDAENALSSRDYQLVLEKTEMIADRKKRALEILDSIWALELRIGEVSEIGDTAKAEEKLAEADAFFENENYGEAEDAVFEGERYLRQVEGEYSIVKARYGAARDNTVTYVKERWKELVLLVLLVLAAIGVSYSKVSRMRDVKMLEGMRLRRGVVDGLILKVQKDYFSESKISRKVYDIKMRRYREKMLELDERILVFESQLGID
jgi:hypothetical protein